MADYREMYYILFNAMSESCERMLFAIQQAEALYLDESTPAIQLMRTDEGSHDIQAPE